MRGSGEKDIEHQTPINILGSASHGLRPTSSIEGMAEEKAGTWETCVLRGWRPQPGLLLKGLFS